MAPATQGRNQDSKQESSRESKQESVQDSAQQASHESPLPRREIPDAVVRYDLGTICEPIEYHSEHGHLEKLGLILYENTICKQMIRRQKIIFDMQDKAEELEAAGKGDEAAALTVEGETLEQHQQALQDLNEHGQRASEAFAELSERVLREGAAKRLRATQGGGWWPQRLI